MVKRGPSENYVLTDEERPPLLAVCKTVQDRVIISLALYCGLREGESVHLDSRWLRDGQNISIPSQMTCTCLECSRRERNRGHWLPKSKAGCRVIGLPRIVRDDLEPFLARYPGGLRQAKVSRFSYYRSVKRLCKAAGIVIPGLGGDTAFPHCLRATCATLLAKGGMNAPQLMYHMGWSDLKMAQ